MKIYRVEKDGLFSGLNLELSVHLAHRQTCKPESRFDRCAFASLPEIFQMFPQRSLVCASIYEIEVKRAKKCGWHLSFSEDDVIAYRQICYSEIVSRSHDFLSKGEQLYYSDNY